MSVADWPQPSTACLRQARQGDREAASRIIDVYREQLKRVVEARLDPRLAARFDASDVVHDVLASACQLITAWLEQEKVLYACLHRLVRDRLATLRRDHIETQKRSVNREAVVFADLSDGSVLNLCQRLGVHGDTPSEAAMRKESQLRIRDALGQLRETDREVLVMRVLEGTPAKEVAEVLDISESAVNMRQLRALKKMRSLLQ
jgi:RNA polymerase sigma-70 factor (ECF subfamily)